MTNSVGRVLTDQALVASDGAQLHGFHPSGVDPSRITGCAKRLTQSQFRNLCALPRNEGVWMTVSEMRASGATGAGMDVLFIYHLEKPWRVCERRFVQWGSERGQKPGKGYEYSITRFGQEVRAIAIETATAAETGTGSVHESAGRRHRPDASPISDPEEIVG